jgi:hypothetical protein
MASAKIASIHWYPVETQRAYRGASYQLPAVGELNGKPKFLTTHDLFQFDKGPMMPGTNKRQDLQYLVRGEEIARCIVGEWTGTTMQGMGMNPDRHPGIWIIRTHLPVIERTKKTVDDEDLTYEEKMVLDASGSQVFREADHLEKQQMWDYDFAHAVKADRAYAEWCWDQGNQIYHAWMHPGGKPVPREIPPLYKAAARHYGLDADWLKEAASSNMKNCAHCDNMIRKDAMLCGKCLEPNDLKRWAKWKAIKEQAVLEAASEPDEEMPSPAARVPRPIGMGPQPQV